MIIYNSKILLMLCAVYVWLLSFCVGNVNEYAILFQFPTNSAAFSIHFRQNSRPIIVFLVRGEDVADVHYIQRNNDSHNETFIHRLLKRCITYMYLRLMPLRISWSS